MTTNFNIANKNEFNRGINHCWRYITATKMLESSILNNNLSVDACRNILEETALYPGYSFVSDLINGLIYLYSHNDFDRVAILNIHDELSKGVHSYAIETLVTQQSGIMSAYIFNSFILSIIIIFAMIGLTISVYFFSVKPKLQLYSQKKEINNELKQVFINKLITLKPTTRLLIMTFCSIASFTLLKSFIKIGPIYIIGPVWTFMLSIYPSFLLISIIGLNFRPWISIILSVPGLIVRELVFCSLYGYGGELWIQLIFTFCSFAGAVVVVSFFRGKNEIIAILLFGEYS